VTAEKERVLCIFEARQTVDDFPGTQVQDLESAIGHGGEKQALLFEIHGHVV
jgi:hypothetical protein